MRLVFPLAYTLLASLAAAGIAQDKKSPPDHGRVLATCIEVAPGKLKDTTKLSDTRNYVFRGQVVSLGKDRKVSICYDTDHMRVAGAWLGKPVVYAADKNMGPAVEGEMLFATKPGPGWAKDGKWDDPRVGKEGPLPRDWAHYKGMYLHGDKVVLSYTVGDMAVLEMPRSTTYGDETFIVRQLRLGATKASNRLLICEMPHNPNQEVVPTIMMHTQIAGEKGLSQTLEIGSLLRVGIAGSTGARIHIDNTRIFAEFHSLPRGGDLRIIYQKPGKGRDLQSFLSTAKADWEGLPAMTKGGPPRWTQALETTVTPGNDKSGPYTLDPIALPEANPWNASIRFSALDFFPDGRAALSTWDGDVWIVSGLGERGASPAAKLKWKRFAAGLHAPLGLKIINGIIHVAGRDQITKLHDLNGDGEADFYENFNNDAGLTLQRHEYVMDLQTDKDGNLYYCRSGHYIQSKRGDNCCIYKLPPDGSKLERFATGFREPNGMSIGPDGVMTVADNEGNGIPQTPLYRLKAGADYGFTPSTTGNPNQGTFTLKEKPVVWLGPKIDTSAGGQVWAPKEWGPLGGQLLHTSYGNCALFSVLIDKQAEPWQGAVWRFPFQFTSGIMRARFNPADGQLYVCGLRGWGTSAIKDGQFARVRFNGVRTPLPVGYRVAKTGIELKFSEPLDKASVEDDDNWAGTWSAILKKVPNAQEKQDLPIAAVHLAADRKTVTIELEQMRPVPNFTLQYRFKSADGAPLTGEVHGTIHRVP